MVDLRRRPNDRAALASDRDRAVDLDVALGFAQIARLLATERTEDELYRRVVALALDTVDGVDHAGVFVLEDGQIRGRAVSDEFVDVIDGLQLECGEGPCLDAMFDPEVTYCCASDLSIAVEWPAFGPRATAAGLRSVLSVRLFADRPVSLNLYGRLPAAYGAVDRTKALLLASHAGTALQVVESRMSEITRSRDLERGLEMRSVIGQAQGILMERERITAVQAFDVLRRASQALNVKLRDVAQRLVDTGESPLGASPTFGEPTADVAPRLVHDPQKSGRSD